MATKEEKKEKKNKKKKRHPIRNTLLILIVLGLFGLAGLWRFGGFDWGYQGGESESTTAAENNETTAQTTVAETTEAQTETTVEAVLNIVVSEDKITVGAQECDGEEALKKAILSAYEDGMAIELVDEKAVKANYDMAKKVLDDLGYSYKESVR